MHSGQPVVMSQEDPVHGGGHTTRFMDLIGLCTRIRRVMPTLPVHYVAIAEYGQLIDYLSDRGTMLVRRGSPRGTIMHWDRFEQYMEEHPHADVKLVDQGHIDRDAPFGVSMVFQVDFDNPSGFDQCVKVHAGLMHAYIRDIVYQEP